MGAAALAVLLIVGVSVVAWHFTKQERKLLNRSSRRKRGMVSNLLFIIPGFFCIFSMNF